MPHVDGMEATQRIKADPALRDIPIIACTARAEQLPPDGGFTSVLSKPCGPDRVLAAISSALGCHPA
jgi:two-component system cell cycle response regulator DivK